MKTKILTSLLIIAIIIHLLLRIYDYRNDYLTKFDPKHWEQLYNNSQWVIPNSAKPIGDDGLYIYAAWRYINGSDPTTLNAELPPFGKYLVGISEILFYNPNIFALLSSLFALIAFYFFNIQILKSKFLALIPVLLFSLEPLFYSQLSLVLFDTLFLGLLCLVFYFFLRKEFILSAIFFGLLAATKSAASTFPLVIFVCLAYFLITKQFTTIKKYAFSLPISFLVFLATYTQYFLLGNSFREFLGVQKWIVAFYANGAKGSIIAPWEMIFTGSFANWFNGKTIVTEWNITWPILILISLGTIIYIVYLTSSKKNPHFIAKNKAIWILTYLLFLSSVPLCPRYFIVVLPFMYTLTIWLICHKLLNHEKA